MRRTSWIYRGPWWTAPRCARFLGGQDGAESHRLAQEGQQNHVITDAHGTPLACRLTGANRHDVTQLIGLTRAIPAIRSKPGRPVSRPKCLYADPAYDSELHRILLRWRGIEPCIAERGEPHGSGLGKYRCVVERTISWLHQHRRLRIRYEKRADIHEAFMTLGCVMICSKTLHTEFC